MVKKRLDLDLVDAIMAICAGHGSVSLVQMSTPWYHQKVTRNTIELKFEKASL
jgi:hypothetical protein